jgi:hypothetical protein
VIPIVNHFPLHTLTVALVEDATEERVKSANQRVEDKAKQEKEKRDRKKDPQRRANGKFASVNVHIDPAQRPAPSGEGRAPLADMGTATSNLFHPAVEDEVPPVRSDL